MSIDSNSHRRHSKSIMKDTKKNKIAWTIWISAERQILMTALYTYSVVRIGVEKNEVTTIMRKGGLFNKKQKQLKLRDSSDGSKKNMAIAVDIVKARCHGFDEIMKNDYPII
ncbi:hypothetical protein BDEG_24682 [Batrachochytrium dendrobatidis JEL423]|uniref:Uncharacterized protein n=1 Tax=Batrachochytrium dendrobatidis (strain JEL423) TaxID=403673 RepID=A0A177WLN0_BATDL|nr:hypothetical protein BDEG_24682 [Batrachochytrium dendrobatidis JEL423]